MDPKRRRQRPAVSCVQCRRRKVRCNRVFPCENCTRTHKTCVFDVNPPLEHQTITPSREGIPHDLRTTPSVSENLVRSNATTSTRTSTSARVFTAPGSPVVDSSADLPDSVSSVWSIIPHSSDPAPSKRTLGGTLALRSDFEASGVGLGGVFGSHEDRILSEKQKRTIVRSISHKGRLFGQTHWVLGSFPHLRDLVDDIEPYVPKERWIQVSNSIQKCKRLARVIKLQRAPPWPHNPTTDLPPKDLADSLLSCYLQTIETVYRILHLPSFQKDYDALWTQSNDIDLAFLVQLKLILAIGAATNDDQFTHRTLAAGWVYEAQTWLSKPGLKSRLGISLLQTYLLLILARELVGVDEDTVWIEAGTALRISIHMGLHRDPSRLPRKTHFAAEMHRRLWNTTLDILLQASLSTGNPPLISLDDFDTEPPGNFDDGQLDESGKTEPSPKPPTEMTDMSVAIAFQKTYAQRLAMIKFMNDCNSSGTYSETMRLDTELRSTYKALSRTLQGFRSPGTPSRIPSDFQTGFVDYLMQRYLSALHMPYFGVGMHDTAFAYSRKVVTETCLKLWAAACPPSLHVHGPSSPDTKLGAIPRLGICGFGFFHTAGFQAYSALVLELRTQLMEEEGLGPSSVRPDLAAVPEQGKSWCLCGIKAGETNVKGYMMASVIAAQIEGLQRGVAKDQLASMLIDSAEQAAEESYPFLKEMMGGVSEFDEPMEGLELGSLSDLALTEGNWMEGWDFWTTTELDDFI